MSSFASDALISVLIPAYNHERYVETAVRSVIGQDWPRMELIVIDDGSRDGTWRVLEHLREECQRRFECVDFRTQPNAGPSATMNRLVSAARGDFIAILASDDFFLPDAFRALYAPMAADPGVGVTVGQNIVVDAEGRRGYWDSERNLLSDEKEAVFRTLNAFMASVSGVDPDGPRFGAYGELVRINHLANGCLIRASALHQTLPFTPEAPLEDWWMHLQLAKVTRYVSVPTPTFAYRWHGTNAMLDGARIRDLTRRTLLHEVRCVRQSGDSVRLRELGAVPLDERRMFGSRKGLHVRRLQFADRIELKFGVGSHETRILRTDIA